MRLFRESRISRASLRGKNTSSWVCRYFHREVPQVCNQGVSRWWVWEYSYRRGEALAQAQGGDYRALCDSGTSAEELQGSRCASGCWHILAGKEVGEVVSSSLFCWIWVQEALWLRSGCFAGRGREGVESHSEPPVGLTEIQWSVPYISGKPVFSSVKNAK